MNRQSANKLQEEVEKKYERREKKRKIKMKVSGAGVKGLQKIIMGKNIKNYKFKAPNSK